MWGNLEHYWADSDIRDREPAHRAMQNTEKKLVRLLRTDAPDSELARVNCFGYS
jgi:Membrane-associated lipoprotein involved in thiamine biosynthesis